MNHRINAKEVVRLSPEEPSSPVSDPRAPRMWACWRGEFEPRLGEHPQPGDLVLVEVPPNCTIHDADARSLSRILAIADQIGQHWRDQEGVNGQLLDELADATDRDRVLPPERKG